MAMEFAVDAGALVFGERQQPGEGVERGVTSSVCSAISKARQLGVLPATTAPKRSRMRPRGGAIRRALMRFSSASVA